MVLPSATGVVWKMPMCVTTCYEGFFAKTAHSKSSFFEERVRMMRTVIPPLPVSSRLVKVCLTRRKTREMCEVSHNGVAGFVDLLARMREKSGTRLTCLAIDSRDEGLITTCCFVKQHYCQKSTAQDHRVPALHWLVSERDCLDLLHGWSRLEIASYRPHQARRWGGQRARSEKFCV